ncbi:MAG TPA: outer membrane protein assembly factor BamA, partial [Candidatus Saccharimonadales bacterium]|nr:outer membrane protein assembly factor BamA [Candidatus Saccharimonadales bacterium]
RRIELRRVNLRNGTLEWEGHSGAFSVDARGIDATAASIPCNSALCAGGNATVSSLDLRFQEHRLRGDQAALKFEYADGKIRVPSFRISGAGLSAGGDAVWSALGERSGEVHASFSTAPPALGDLTGGLPFGADALEASLTISGEPGAIEVKGDARARNVTAFGRVRARSALGTFGWRDGNLTSDISAHGVLPSLGGFAAARDGSLQASLEMAEGGAATMKLRAGPFLFTDTLARLDPRLPRADLLASTDGTLTWTSGDAGSLKGSLGLTLEPAGDATAEEPGRTVAGLSGTARLDVSRDRIGISDGKVAGPGMEAGVDGTIWTDGERADLDVTLEHVDLEPVLKNLDRFSAVRPAISQEVRGTAAGSLHVAVRPAGARVTGRLTGADVGLRAGKKRLERLHVEATFDASGHRVEIGQLGITAPGWTARSSLLLDTSDPWPLRRAHAQIQGMPAEPVWEMTGAGAMEGGSLTGTAFFDLDDTERTGTEGRLDMDLAGGRFAGVDLEKTHLAATERQGVYHVDRLDVSAVAGSATLDGTWAPDTGRGELDVTSHDLRVRELIAGWAPDEEGYGGLAGVDGHLSISPEGTTFEGSGRGSDIEVRGFPLGQVSSPRIRYATAPGAGLDMDAEIPSLGTTGTLRLPPGGEESLAITASAKGLDLAKLRPLLSEQFLPGLSGTSDLSLTGSFPLHDAWGARMTAGIETLSLEVGGLDFSLTSATKLELLDGRLHLGEARLTGKGTDLVLEGVYDLRSGAAGTGSVSGSFDTSLLGLAVPGIEAHGIAKIDLQVTGENGALRYEGRLDASGVSLDYPGSPAPAENLSLSAKVDPSGKIDFGEIAFDFSGGHVTGSGTAKLEGFSLENAQIDLHGSGLVTEPVPDLVILYDAGLAVTANGGHGLVSGRLDVIRAVYSKELGLESAAGSFGGSRRVPHESVSSGGPSLGLNIEIVAPSDVLVRNQTANLEGSARLRVNGTLSKPELTGRISVFEGGTFRFRDVTYTSDQGGILFDDPDKLDPLLDITATTDVKEYTITLHATDRWSNPRFELTSQPALSQTDIVSLLVTGETAGTGLTVGAPAGLLADENVTQYLTAPLSATLGKTVGRALGLTSVQLQPMFVNGSADPSARLTMTKRVSPRLLFTYSDNLGTSQDEIYQFEYDLSRAWQFVGAREADGSVSGNLRFHHRWGGPPRAAAPGQTGETGGTERLKISRVEFEGSPVGGDRTLRKKAGIAPGRPYSRADALEARENLREWISGRGYPLASIGMDSQERTRSDGEKVVDLTYKVRPGDHIELDINGVRHDRALQHAVQGVWDRAINPEDLAERGRKAIETSLGASGYATAKVTTDVIPKDSLVRIRYTVDRGPKVSVSAIDFSGVSAVPEKDLLKVMATREDHWDTSGTLRPPDLKADREAIRAVYLSHGYLDAFVDDPVITYSSDRSEASIEIPVDEGEQWKIGEVSIEGDVSYPKESLVQATLLRPGATLRPSGMDSARERLRDLLDGNGYYEVRVRSRFDGPPSGAQVTFSIEQGPHLVIDRVDVRGNKLTADRVIRREISMRPGDPVSRLEMLDLQKRLYSLGLFRTVEVRAEPLEADPSRARIVVDIEESDPILTGFGFGYDTQEQFQGLVHIGNNNVGGTGRSVSFLARGSAKTKRVQGSLADRRLFGVPFEGILTASWEEEQRASFRVQRTGTGLQFKRELTRQLTALGRYDLSDVRLRDVQIDPGTTLDVQDQEILDRAARLAHVGASLALDTRDDILAPTHGGFSTADLGVFAPVFASEYSFTRLYLSTAHFKELRSGIVLGGAFRVGQENPFGSTNGVPLAARFFSGGDTTLRGFKIDEAGPLDFTTKEPVGGEFQLLINMEARFPIWGALKGVLFYDLGNTFLRPRDFRLDGTKIITAEVSRPGDCAFDLTPFPGESTCPVAIQDGLRHTLGAGLRLNTPLGPIRLEVGRKMDRRFGIETFDLGSGFRVQKRREESLYEVFLSIGQAF